MENASKALIIAGAILLAILLISLGMMVLNKATGILDSEQLDQAAVTTFNQKFTKYEGEKVKGSNVRSLISEVAAYNGSEDRVSSGEAIITLTGGAGVKTDSDGKISGTVGISNTKYYKVEITERTKGKVSKIQIDNFSTTPTNP